jgi:phage terminase small subunit
MAERAERTEVTDLVVGELRKIAFANMADYMKSTPEGDPYLDFSALSRGQTATLSEVTVEQLLVSIPQFAAAGPTACC